MGAGLHPAPIVFLWACTDLWDAIGGGNRDVTDLLNRKLAERLASVRFQLAVSPDGSRFLLGYRPAKLIDALWQRFAEEIADIIHCARCPAPRCGRWFFRSAARSDRQYCSHACRMRAWRGASGQYAR